MSNAVVLFRASESNEWLPYEIITFNVKAADYKKVPLGTDEVELRHAVAGGHSLFLTHRDDRVYLWPSGGNEPEENAPRELYDIRVVGHYDSVGPDGQTYRIYHQRTKEARW